MTLDWLWPRLADDEKQALQAAVGAFQSRSPDRRELLKFGNDPVIAELEKRFLRQSPEQLNDY